MNHLKYFSFLFVFSFISCEKEEIPINPHLAGEVIIQQVELEKDYKNQVFYKLSNNSIVSNNIKTEWDLGFINHNNDDYIILNSSTFMQAANGPGSFENVIDINSLQWEWDNPRGIDFGTAISYELDNSNIYIIDRGYSLNGNNRGYKKFMITEVTDYYYMIRYSNLDNSGDTVIQINKENGNNFITYSFDEDEKILIFPDEEDWDLVFTQYTNLFSDTTTPAYLVTGVLTNYYNNITVSFDTINDFEQINLSMIDNYNFSNNQDQIGYSWKAYDLQNNLYVINNQMTYLIKDSEGRYFKLQFIDFYNDIGDKGYPQFKIQEL